MKNFKKLFFLASIVTLAFTACKYEDGPGISLTSKRDRLSNEWTITDYNVQDNSDASNDTLKKSFINGDSIELVWTIMRTGHYNMNVAYTNSYSEKNGGVQLPSNQSTIIAEKKFDYTKNVIFSKIGSSGKWTFDHRHNKAQFGRDLSKASDSEVLRCEILELRNKKVKMSFFDAAGKKNTVTLEPKNKEPKQFK